MKSISDYLAQCPWTAHLSADQLARVRSDIIRRFHPAGSIIAPRQKRLEHWLGVIDGVAVLGCDSVDGKRTTFTVVSEGGWFGEGALLKNQPLKFEAYAKTDCHIACLPGATFFWLYEHSIRFNHALIDQLNEHCGQFLEIIAADRVGKMDELVVQCILTLVNPVLNPGAGKSLPMSQEEIGYLTGLSRQTVNQVLKNLERKGLIKVGFRHLTILDLPSLINFVVDDRKPGCTLRKQAVAVNFPFTARVPGVPQ
jgi:CRP-like cAMP-binding protein